MNNNFIYGLRRCFRCQQENQLKEFPLLNGAIATVAHSSNTARTINIKK